MSRFAAASILLSSLLCACQEPFGVDRHDLQGDRIAAIEATPAGDGVVVVRAFAIVSGRPWQDEPVGYRWSWLDPDAPDLQSVTPLDPADGTGPVTVLELPDPNGPNVLGLLARFPSGLDHRSVLSLPAGGPIALAEEIRLDDRAVALTLDATPDDLDRDRRATLSTSPVHDDASWWRMRPVFDGRPGWRPPGLTRVRWMATAGTFLELDLTRTDWAAADLVLDGLEIDASTPLADGPVTFLVLALDDAGSNLAHAADRHLGPAPMSVRTFDRLLPVDTEPGAATLVRGTLVADDDSPVGLALEGAVATTRDDLPFRDPWGTDDLDCAVTVSGAFDPTWLFDGRCTRDQVVGHTVAVVVDP